jgi:hypothetical protein
MSDRRAAARVLALAAEAALLAHVAGLGALGSAGLAAAALAIARLLRGSPAALEALAFGGLGMTAGWWTDLGFASLAVASPAPALPPEAWCGSAGALAGVRLLSWMNAGMLAGAAVSARLAGCTAARFALEAAGMLLGMHLAARALAPLALERAPALAVLAPLAAMSAGMLAGMQLARLEWLRLCLGRALLVRLRAARFAAD